MEHYFDPYTKKEIIGYYKEPEREIPIIDHVDVLVVGGSPSGVAAAVSAARTLRKYEEKKEGKGREFKVMLIERFGFLGGQSVFGSVTQWEKRAFINNLGAVATRGIAKEMLDRIVEKGNSDGLWKTPPGCEEMRDGEEWLDPEDIKLTLIEFCEEAGVSLLFHTLAVDVILDKKEKSDAKGENAQLPTLKGVIFENKSGRFAYTADVIIDATADADLVWKAIGTEGCRIIPPEERVGAGFYVYYGGVNNQKFIEYALSLPDIRGYPDPKLFPEKVRKHLKEGKLIIFNGFSEIIQKADELGLLDPLEELAEKYTRSSIIMISLGMKWVGDGRWNLHITAFQNLNLLDIWELTNYEILRTKLEHLVLKIVRLIPGWENAFIDRTNLCMGSRQTRHIKALYMLTKDDIFNPNHEREDCVGRSGAHDPGKNRLKYAYPIPYGIMVPKNLEHVLVCTRAVGCADRIAVNAHRGITPTIVVGQAAGTAAAVCIAKKLTPHHMDLKELREQLRAADVVLDKETIDLGIKILKPEKIKKIE